VSNDRHHQIGMSRRELEKECGWITRHMPSDPAALAKLLTQLIVTLIDMNNAAIAKHHGNDDDKPGAP
jgi:hypothetical protein